MLLTVAGLSTLIGLLPIKSRRVVPLNGVGVTDVGAVGVTSGCFGIVAPLTTFAPNRSAFFRNGYEFGSPHNTENALYILVALFAIRLAKGILY